MERITNDHFLRSPVDERILGHMGHPMINSVERDGRINGGEVNEVRETPR